MVEVEVFGLALDESSQIPLLILKDQQEQHVLPIWIGVMEAVAISMTLNDVDMPRPMTHDLFLNTLGELGGELQRVEVVNLNEGTFYAELVVRSGETTRRIDSRPSDAVALALRAQCPIFVHEVVFETVEKRKGQNYEVGVQEEEAEKWTDVLESFDLEDLKYKM